LVKEIIQSREEEEEDGVKPTKDVLVRATNTGELEGCRSLYHLRNLLKIIKSSVILNEGGFVVRECEGGLVWTTMTYRGRWPCNA